MQTEKPLTIENTYHWPADGESRPWTEFWVTTFTSPVGTASAANILFTTDPDGNSPWRHLPMEKNCVLGEQDVWHVNLGTFPAGTRIRYAIEAIGPECESVWDNCHNKDHHARIGTAKDLAHSR
jgi:hypothetical protein